MKNVFTTCVIVTALSIVGCGGGSSSSSTTGTQGAQEVFADAPVVGVTYACGGQTGVTGAGGVFHCAAGSTVTLSVGGVTLCSAPAQPFMTPLSCAQATDPSSNTSTPAVLAETQFLMSISTTPASSGTLTITPGELQQAANVTVDFATVSQSTLLADIDAIAGGTAQLVAPTIAQNEINSTVGNAVAGSYSGTYTGGTQSTSGTWTATIGSDGSVSGTATGGGQTRTVAGQFTFGTEYSGTAVISGDSASWTGIMDTSKTPDVFSGIWTDPVDAASGTFTGTKN
jgi:hypothetical protein